MTKVRRRGQALLVSAALIGLIAAVPLASPSSAAGGNAKFSKGFAADVSTLAPTSAYTGYVHFTPAGLPQREILLARHGLTLVRDYPAIAAVIASGTVAQFRAVAGEAGVNYVENIAKIELAGDTAEWATRVGVVRNPAAGGPYRAANSAILDGAGVGVAVVDSGVDWSHPDLKARVAKNFKVVCATPFLIDTTTGQCFRTVVQPMPPGVSSDTTSGHGTHVAGIVAGDGTASSGNFKGVATGSTLYAFGVGEALSAAWAGEALYYILTHYNSFSPAIKVINNSYGNPAGSGYDPNGALEKTVNALVTQKGVTMVFAAGNDGGDGSADMTSGYCKDPTAGVICVANYDDSDSGHRNNALDAGSSRGKNGAPTTYPDVAAPGANITSTCQVTNALCNAAGFLTPSLAWEPWYRNAYGTSMSAPHVAGIAALMLQAKPTLTPADVEDILLDTAHKFGTGYVSDPQNGGSTTSFDKGAGLADAPAALRDARIGVTGDNAASPSVLATGDAGDFLVGAADLVSASVAVNATGLTYSFTVANAADRGPTGSVAYVLRANVDGLARETTAILNASGANADATEGTDADDLTAMASAVSLAGNTVTVTVPYSRLGNPAPGSPVHNFWAASYIGPIVDSMPSPTGLGATGLDGIIRPLRGPAFTTG